ncbi:hypothetical protein ABIA65_003277 [Mycolicibacterium sp. 624]
MSLAGAQRAGQMRFRRVLTVGLESKLPGKARYREIARRQKS